MEAKITPAELAVVDITSEDGLFYVAHIDDDDGHHKLVVTFRGTVTESSTNWITNLDAFYQEAKFRGVKYIKGRFGGGHSGRNSSSSSSGTTETTHANMHRGFYKLYEMMSDDVLTTMAEVVVHEPMGLSTEVIVVGHSLAGVIVVVKPVHFVAPPFRSLFCRVGVYRSSRDCLGAQVRETKERKKF